MYERSKYDSDNVDFFRIRDIANSLTYSQLKSKQWAVKEFLKVKETLPNLSKSDYIVMGGWYGLLAHLLTPHLDNKIYSIDMDRGCADLGSQIYSNVNFLVEDALEHFFNIPKNYGWIFNTSVEHMEKEDIDLILRLKREDAFICFQSNDYFEEPSHINCSKSLNDFIHSLNLKKIYYSGEMNVGVFNRFMVIGR